MSIDATRFVWKLSSKLVTASEKILLLSMADRANESHKCWPSQRRLEQDTCLNRKTIIKCIQSLEQKGLIMKCAEKKGRLNRINVYQLVGVPGRDDEPPIDEVPNSPKNTTFNSPNSGTFNSPNFGTQNLKEESKNKSIPPIVPHEGNTQPGESLDARLPKVKPRTPMTVDEMLADNPHYLPKEAIEDWLLVRGKHIVTRTAWNSLNRELAKIAALQQFTALEAFEHGIANNWRSVHSRYTQFTNPRKSKAEAYDVHATGWSEKKGLLY